MSLIRFRGEVPTGRSLTESEVSALLDHLSGALALHTGRVIRRSSETIVLEFTHWPFVVNWNVLAGVIRGEVKVDPQRSVLYTFDQSSLVTAIQVGSPVVMIGVVMVIVGRFLPGLIAFAVLAWLMVFLAYLISASRIRSLISSIAVSA